MNVIPAALEKVIQELSRFPGIGRKTAQRLGFHLLATPVDEVQELADALTALKRTVGECSQCHHLAEQDLCEICSSGNRDHGTVCVVENPIDVLIFERMGEYKGLYHVLGGVISPLDGISPADLNIRDLLDRMPEIQELIIATHPSIEGDTTAIYIAGKVSAFKVRLTRLARGIPVGMNLEFADEATLANAYISRTEF